MSASLIIINNIEKMHKSNHVVSCLVFSVSMLKYKNYKMHIILIYKINSDCLCKFDNFLKQKTVLFHVM